MKFSKSVPAWKYILVAIAHERYAAVIGWAYRTQLLRAPTTSFGYGESYYIEDRWLFEQFQDGLPYELPVRPPERPVPDSVKDLAG